MERGKEKWVGEGEGSRGRSRQEVGERAEGRKN